MALDSNTLDSGAAKAQQTAKKKKTRGFEKIVVADRFEVDPNHSLSEYDMPPALAYACEDFEKGEQSIALVCDPKMPLRLRDLPTYKAIEHAGLQKIFYFGNVHWESEGRECPILIAENPRGARIFTSLDEVITPLDEEDVLIRFMRPAIRYMRIMRDAQFTHRSIRPTNLFYGDENRTKIILGEPISAISGINQPIVCEPIESGLTLPAGRGHGTPADDIYALAVTFMSLLIGHLPCRGMSNEDILKKKISIGSYQTIVGNMEFSRMAFELFQGCLEDNPSSRWRIDELGEWIGGRHFPLRKHLAPPKTAGALTIGGEDYYTPKTLAQGIAKHWDESKSFVAGGDIEIWLRRYVADSEYSANVQKAKIGLNLESVVNQERLLFRMITALDSQGPIRIKDLSVMVGGFGGVLAFYKGNTQMENLVLQAIGSDVISFWTEIYPGSLAFYHNSINRLTEAQKEHRINRFGGGIESYRYFLNSGLNCLSPIFENFYVFDIYSLLVALEKIASQDPERIKNSIIDREIAAFIVNRAGKDMRSDIQTIESAIDPDQGRIQQIRVLANLQERHPELSLPNFCKVSADFLKPALNKLYGMQNRRRLYNRMLSIAKIGTLAEIISAVNDSEEIENDITGFEIAKAEFKKVTKTIKNLEELIASRQADSTMVGGRVAAGVSGMISCILAVSIIFYIEIL